VEDDCESPFPLVGVLLPTIPPVGCPGIDGLESVLESGVLFV